MRSTCRRRWFPATSTPRPPRARPGGVQREASEPLHRLEQGDGQHGWVASTSSPGSDPLTAIWMRPAAGVHRSRARLLVVDEDLVGSIEVLDLGRPATSEMADRIRRAAGASPGRHPDLGSPPSHRVTGCSSVPRHPDGTRPARPRRVGASHLDADAGQHEDGHRPLERDRSQLVTPDRRQADHLGEFREGVNPLEQRLAVLVQPAVAGHRPPSSPTPKHSATSIAGPAEGVVQGHSPGQTAGTDQGWPRRMMASTQLPILPGRSASIGPDRGEVGGRARAIAAAGGGRPAPGGVRPWPRPPIGPGGAGEVWRGDPWGRPTDQVSTTSPAPARFSRSSLASSNAISGGTSYSVTDCLGHWATLRIRRTGPRPGRRPR